MLLNRIYSIHKHRIKEEWIFPLLKNVGLKEELILNEELAIQQINFIQEMVNIGDVRKSLELLAELGYKIGDNYLLKEENVLILKYMAPVDKSQFKIIFQALREHLGFHGFDKVNDLSNMKHLTLFLNQGGNYDLKKAITQMGEKNYKVGKKEFILFGERDGNLTKRDKKEIFKNSKKLLLNVA